MSNAETLTDEQITGELFTAHDNALDAAYAAGDKSPLQCQIVACRAQLACYEQLLSALPGAAASGREGEVLAKLERAHETVVDLCQGRARWTMSIPARPDVDPDLIIGGALREAIDFLSGARSAPRPGGEGDDLRPLSEFVPGPLMPWSQVRCPECNQGPVGFGFFNPKMPHMKILRCAMGHAFRHSHGVLLRLAEYDARAGAGASEPCRRCEGDVSVRMVPVCEDCDSALREVGEFNPVRAAERAAASQPADLECRCPYICGVHMGRAPADRPTANRPTVEGDR